MENEEAKQRVAAMFEGALRIHLVPITEPVAYYDGGDLRPNPNWILLLNLAHDLGWELIQVVEDRPTPKVAIFRWRYGSPP